MSKKEKKINENYITISGTIPFDTKRKLPEDIDEEVVIIAKGYITKGSYQSVQRDGEVDAVFILKAIDAAEVSPELTKK